MPTFEAKVKYIDVRVITIEADDIEQAREKYESGDWLSEDTVDFYADEDLELLHEVRP